MSTERELKNTLAGRGGELPRAKRADALRQAVLSSAGVEQAVIDEPRVASPGRPSVRTRTRPLYRSRLAVATAAVACAVIALTVVGVLSMNAVPGSPLYPVKRMLQRARVVLSVGAGSSADASLASADSRISDLQYAKSKEMKSWYAPLLRSAGHDVKQAVEEDPSAATAAKAKDTMDELQNLANEIGAEVDQELHQELDGLQQQIEREVQQEIDRMQQELDRELDQELKGL